MQIYKKNNNAFNFTIVRYFLFFFSVNTFLVLCRLIRHVTHTYTRQDYKVYTRSARKVKASYIRRKIKKYETDEVLFSTVVYYGTFSFYYGTKNGVP